MKCDICKREINYCFYINKKYWKKAVSKKKFDKSQGYLCAHCVLEKLGGLYWHIVLDEPRINQEEKEKFVGIYHGVPITIKTQNKKKIQEVKDFIDEALANDTKKPTK